MKLNTTNIQSENVIYITTGDILDITAYRIFYKAALLATASGEYSAIVLDFARTHHLFDSGKAMLLFLRRESGRLKNQIYLTNVRPNIKRKLLQSGQSRLFNIFGGRVLF